MRFSCKKEHKKAAPPCNTYLKFTPMFFHSSQGCSGINLNPPNRQGVVASSFCPMPVGKNEARQESGGKVQGYFFGATLK